MGAKRDCSAVLRVTTGQVLAWKHLHDGGWNESSARRKLVTVAGPGLLQGTIDQLLDVTWISS